MGLPAIESYPMPDRSSLPASHVAWTVAPERTALLVHGMQNQFIDAFPAGSSPVRERVENVAALRGLAGALGMPVVFSAEPVELRNGSVKHRAATSEGPEPEPDATAVIERLAPRPGEHLLRDMRPDAFLRSHLGRLLRSQGRDQLIVCGLYAHLGVLLTAADAAMNDFRPFVVADAVADFSAEEHTMALRWVARSGVVRTTDGPLRELLPHRERRNTGSNGRA
ncbi:isochorismatase family protein [Streptomyces antibioticus]|uniref:isochorismatase family protein n=1 Tax=Streptomyces antibioticus TaxID=1890 RepID=UPI0036BE7FD5